jgi:hypothetical protein
VADNTWHVVTKDGVHTIGAEHGYISGRIKVYVDGQLVLNKFKQHSPLNLSSLHPFTVGGEEAALYIESDMFRYNYDLIVSGRSLKSGELVPVETQTQTRNRVPLWAWPLALGCLVSYFVGYALALRLFDAHPGSYVIWHGLGIGAALLCLRVASNTRLPALTRVERSVGILIGTGVLSAALAVAVMIFNQANWHTASPADNSYKVLVPCALKEEVKGDPTSMECRDAIMQYTVWYERLDGTVIEEASDAILASIVEGVKHPDTGQKVQVTNQRKVRLGGRPGIEVTARYKDSTVLLRAYVVESRLYQVMAIAQTKTFNKQRASKFLDSFQVIGTSY